MCRRSGRCCNAWTSRAVCAEFLTASACVIESGSILRALDVDTDVDGINAIALMRGSTSTCTDSATLWLCCSSCQAIVAPPKIAAATLSGWPSISLAKFNISSLLIRSLPPKTSARASDKPPTIALADDPRPRVCGITFKARSAIPRGFPPRNSKPLYIDLITKFFSLRGIASAPSPDISISITCSSKTCAMYLSCRPRAKPKESKPGPKFALVAGTCTCIAWALKVGFILDKA